MEINLTGVEVTPQTEMSRRMAMLLWGDAGCGKTVLACSAPGNKLLINFDPDGPDSLGKRPDVMVADLSGENHSVTSKFKTDDPLNISRALADDENGIETVIVDSITSYSQIATDAGIASTKGATLERPSPGAYGARNNLTLRMVSAINRITHKYNKHVIFISHEAPPVTDDSNTVLHITMMLGGSLMQSIPLKLSEVWYMQDIGKDRRILTRPGRTRKPMKTRMFDTSKKSEFISPYDQFGKDAPYGEGSLKSYIDKYRENDYDKIKIP